MKVAQILTALPLLSQADLAAVNAAIGRLVEQKGVRATVPAPPLFEAAQWACNVNVSYQTFARTANYKHWAKNAPLVAEFVTTHFPEAKSKMLHLALSRFLLQLLIEDLNSRQVPISLGIVAVNLGRIPQLFNEQFPHYIESGLTHLIIKRLEKNPK